MNSFFTTTIVVSVDALDVMDNLECHETGDLIRIINGQVNNRIKFDGEEISSQDIINITCMTFMDYIKKLRKKHWAFEVITPKFTCQFSAKPRMLYLPVSNNGIKKCAKEITQLIVYFKHGLVPEGTTVAINGAGMSISADVRYHDEKEYIPGIEIRKSLLAEIGENANAMIEMQSFIRTFCKDAGWSLSEFEMETEKGPVFIQMMQ